MGFKRRAFLGGSVAIVGGGIFALSWQHGAMATRAKAITGGTSGAAFSGWLKIAQDDAITLFSPSVDIGQGSHSALAQMLAEDLDADFAKITVVQAPADPAFADAFIMQSYAASAVTLPALVAGAMKPLYSFVARQMDFQQTSGSNAISGTGQYGMRVIGAVVRQALVKTAAKKLGVAESELTTKDSVVTHGASGRSLRYGEIAAEAAEQSLASTPPLKDRKNFRLIGKSVPRADIPDKVTGKAYYGYDFHLPNMRVATIMAAPVRDGKLISVDAAPALALKGVEKVIKLENAVAVIGKGYWYANRGLQALVPKFSDGGHGDLSSASIYAAQDTLRSTAKPNTTKTGDDVAKAFATPGVKSVEASYRVPFLHHMMMEPFAITAHYSNGKLEIWGGVQAPLEFHAKAVEVSGLDPEKVIFNPMIMGGGFGRRFRSSSQHIVQVIKIAMQVDYPVKLLWSREEDVTQGGYRPQVSAHHKGAVSAQGKIAAWTMDYVQEGAAWSLPDLMVYDIPALEQRQFEYVSNQPFAVWRAVDFTQHGFYVETFMDELAHLAGADPLKFRLNHLTDKPRQTKILTEVAARAGWTTKLPAGVGRGVALITMGNTVVGMVVEASIGLNNVPKVHRIITAVDCGYVVNPDNAAAQIEGGALMGLSAALQEKITLEKGAVVQRNYSDYPILQMSQTPKMETYFMASDADLGGLGEMGVPPVAPALANALFAITGKRICTLPIITQA
jgi:isoquinoline 1-oxidoreductase subunit beta